MPYITRITAASGLVVTITVGGVQVNCPPRTSEPRPTPQHHQDHWVVYTWSHADDHQPRGQFVRDTGI